MQEVFGTLSRLIKKAEESPELRQSLVFAAWKKAAGYTLSENAVPFELDDKKLSVAVADQVWKDHLESLASQMIFKLNSSLGEAQVTFIDFVIKPEEVERTRKNQNEKLHANSGSAKEDRAELSKNLTASASAIADTDLREKFLLAAGACLSRKRRMQMLSSKKYGRKENS